MEDHEVIIDQRPEGAAVGVGETTESLDQRHLPGQGAVRGEAINRSTELAQQLGYNAGVIDSTLRQAMRDDEASSVDSDV